MEPVIDLRPDGERPEAARPLEIDKDALNGILGTATSPRTVEAFQTLAARHQRTLETLRNSRQILFRSNFGVLRFERQDGVLHAVHEIYTAFPKTADETPRPELFVRHRAALATPGAPLPADGLQPLTEDAQV